MTRGPTIELIWFAFGAFCTGSTESGVLAFRTLETTNIGGVISEDSLSGSAIVNPDCTGSMTVHAYNDNAELLRTVEWALVFVDGASESRAMFKSVTLPDGQAAPLVGTASSKMTFPGQSVALVSRD